MGMILIKQVGFKIGEDEFDYKQQLQLCKEYLEKTLITRCNIFIEKSDLKRTVYALYTKNMTFRGYIIADIDVEAYIITFEVYADYDEYCMVTYDDVAECMYFDIEEMFEDEQCYNV